MKWSICILSLLILITPVKTRAQLASNDADFEQLMIKIKSIVETSDTEGFLSLLAPGANIEAIGDFSLNTIRGEISRAIVIPRFILPMDNVSNGISYQLTIEVFTESGNTARLQTWQLNVIRSTATDNTDNSWQITESVSLDSIEGLHHLTLKTTTQYNAENLVIAGEDMTLRMSRGSVFVSEIEDGITGLVLVGNGTLLFSPTPEAERRQVEIFSGNEVLETEFSHAFVRLNPNAFNSHVSQSSFVETSVDRRALRQAQELFDEMSPLTFSINLDDLSERNWWITPSIGNFIAQIRTNKHGDLTYSQTQNSSEDISLYGEDPYRIISLYSSASKRTVRGRYYSEQDRLPYDVLDYSIEASFEPMGVDQESLGARPSLRGCWINGVTQLTLRVTSLNVRSLSLRLHNDLQIHGVTSLELGPLLFFRMNNQNSIVVNLPTEAPIGTELTLNIAYSGLLKADALEENWIGRSRTLQLGEDFFGTIGARYLYSNSSYWYPQATVSDYATATLTLTVPADYGILASGYPDDNNPPIAPVEETTETKSYTFIALQPTRYLSCFITRFVNDDTPIREVVLDEQNLTTDIIRPGVSYDNLALVVESSAYSSDQIDDYSIQAASILKFYASLIGDIPYPIFTLALSDSRLPGGHSPAYFAVLNQPVPVRSGLMLTWRTDPVAFSRHPSFFLAHELAHQWWGQTVGSKNYHEQWLSEGLAQYFAALHVQAQDGDEAFEDVLSEFRRWSIRHSNQGPIYLGSRLGTITGETRIFRAIVYNKSALVLHMLRRLIGDEAFFDGLRRFYTDMRFRPAGTNDLMRAFETESKRSLEDFFERWIHNFDLPTLNFSYKTEIGQNSQQEENAVVLRFEQQGTPFEFPVTVKLNYSSGLEELIIVPVSNRLTEFRVPLSGVLQNIEVNEDNAALTEINR
jgi:hypothetical protein